MALPAERRGQRYPNKMERRKRGWMMLGRRAGPWTNRERTRRLRASRGCAICPTPRPWLRPGHAPLGPPTRAFPRGRSRDGPARQSGWSTEAGRTGGPCQAIFSCAAADSAKREEGLKTCFGLMTRLISALGTKLTLRNWHQFHSLITVFFRNSRFAGEHFPCWTFDGIRKPGRRGTWDCLRTSSHLNTFSLAGCSCICPHKTYPKSTIFQGFLEYFTLDRSLFLIKA